MKQKLFMLPFLAAVAIAAVVGKKTFGLHENESNNLLLQNVEALTNGNESKGESTCKGLLGICSFKCKYCGYSYTAVGSIFKNNHNCKNNEDKK